MIRLYSNYKLLNNFYRTFLIFDRFINQYKKMIKKLITKIKFLLICKPKMMLIKTTNSYNIGLKDKKNRYD